MKPRRPGSHALDTVAADVTALPEARPKTRPVRRDPRGGNRVERDLLLQRVSASLLGESTSPTKVGRFTVVDELGRGAMGVVFRAFDPKLDRKVAIKLVGHGVAGTEAEHAQQRLEREARAAADLSHPNIVTVYDVGIHDAQVFLAMEFVDGQTLSDWITSEPRTWRDVARMFVGVARGLNAAHAAGVVHRDLKPDNVLVTSSGQAKIADFGLARQVNVELDASANGPRALGGLGASPIASTNSICGTPAYMAPEQFSGLDVTPASDQFGFFVSLYEALYGVRPFEGASLSALATNVIEGRRVDPPIDRKPPRALVQLLDRGLATDPGERHPDMGAVADALEHALGGVRRRISVVAGLSVAIAAGAAGVGLHAAAAPSPCNDADARMRSSDGLRARFRDAHPRASAVAEAMDVYADRWSAMAAENCEATNVGGGQSEYAMDLRGACLARAHGRFEGALASLESLPEDVATTSEFDDLLIPLSDCEDVEQLEHLSNRLSTESAHARQSEAEAATEFERQVGGVLVARGRGEDTLDAAQALLAFAEEHHSRQNVALAWSFIGDAQSTRGLADAALLSYGRSVREALAARADATAANATSSRVQLHLAAGRIEAARTELVYLEGLADRSEMRPVVHFVTAVARAELALADNRTADAIADYDAAFELASRHPKVASAQMLAAAHINAGHAHTQNEEPEAALQSYGRALDLLSGGASPVDEAIALLSMGINRANAPEPSAARDYYQRAADKARDALGDDSLLLAQVLGNQGVLERKAGAFDAAASLQTRSLEIREASLGPSDIRLTYPLDELAQIELARGNPDEALRWASRGKLIASDADDGHPQVAIVDIALAEAHAALGHRDDATTLLDGVLADGQLESAPDELERARLARAALDPRP